MIYATNEHDPDFFSVLAAITDGEAVFAGERYEPDGSRTVAYEADGEPVLSNPEETEFGEATFGMDENLFSTILSDYTNRQHAWWREAIQNSVDAGATHITCRSDHQPDGSVLVSCEDDGHGMDLYTFRNKFLMLGGSGKISEVNNKIGGFGKAKELLVLPWLAWRFRTQNLEATGGNWRPPGTKSMVFIHEAPMIRGAKLTVQMRNDLYTTISDASAFLKKCYLPNVEFRCISTNVAGDKSDQIVSADLVVSKELDLGSKADSIPGKLFHDPDGPQEGVLVRTKGLYHFAIWFSGLPGRLFFELAPSADGRKLFTANRESFNGSEDGMAASRGILDFLRKAAADKKSAFRSKAGAGFKIYRGAGRFKPVQAELLGTTRLVLEKNKYKFEEGTAVSWEELLKALAEKRGPAGLDVTTPAQVARGVAENLTPLGSAHVENITKQLAWLPDFANSNMKNDYEDKDSYWKWPDMFEPETMQPTVRKIARLWAELCRLVLIQLNSEEEFNVGFIFDKETKGLHTHRSKEMSFQREHWLLLNPFIDAKKMPSPGKVSVRRDLFNPSDDSHLSLMYAIAVHEATHMVNDLSEHDEEFSYALTMNLAKCWTRSGMRMSHIIRRAIVARDRPWDAPGVIVAAVDPKLCPECGRTLTQEACSGCGWSAP